MEDEPSLLGVARRILQLQGYTVIPAANAEAATRLAAGIEGAIDLLLTDVIMPGDSGSVLAPRLRPRLRVFFMSGYTGDELGAHGVLESSAALLQKPFTARELTDRVREALGAPPVAIPS